MSGCPDLEHLADDIRAAMEPGPFYTRADMARAWAEGYSQRPLYDLQNRANPTVPNPYEDTE
jgi:hypothetical protein